MARTLNKIVNYFCWCCTLLNENNFLNCFCYYSVMEQHATMLIDEFLSSTVREIVKTGVGIWELQYWTQTKWLISRHVPQKSVLKRKIHWDS